MGYPVIPCVHTDETGGGEELPILAVPIMGWEEAVLIPLTRNVGLRCQRSQVMIDRSVPVRELSIEVRFFALSSNCPIAGGHPSQPSGWSQGRGEKDPPVQAACAAGCAMGAAN